MSKHDSENTFDQQTVKALSGQPYGRRTAPMREAWRRHGTGAIAPPVSGFDLLLDNVELRYSGTVPPVLRACSCRIPESGFTAITGPSGAGKSTLLRLIAGIEQLSGGELLIAGLSIRDWGLRRLRKHIAAVFQDDCLLRGTVADNIALFAKAQDPLRVRQAASDACIAAEIEAMPMGYESRIGDLGSSLSNGQRQRILLARAFYRRPKLLLLDDATSGLDRSLERRIVETLLRLQVTRIAVTQSDQVLQAADEVLWLNNGTLLSSRPELNV